MPKPTTQRYRVSEASPAKGSRWVDLGRGLTAQDDVCATFVPLGPDGLDDLSRPTVRLRVALDDFGVPEVRSVLLEGDEPLTSESVRVPLAVMARAAISCFTYRLVGDELEAVALHGGAVELDRTSLAIVDHPVPSRSEEMLPRARPPRSRRMSDELLLRVAETVARASYRERRREVAAEFGEGLGWAKKAIAEARRRGLIATAGEEAAGPPPLSALEEEHRILSERRRRLHESIDLLEGLDEVRPEAAALLERYKITETVISLRRQEIYRQLGRLRHGQPARHET